MTSSTSATGSPASPPSTGSRPALPPPRLEEVADGVHAWIQPDGGWCLNNAGVLTAAGAVMLVDTAATEARARALRAAAHGVCAAEPRVVVSTHHHGDHTFGNAVAAPYATVVAHRETRAQMAEKGKGLQHVWPDVDWGDLGPLEDSLPALLYDDRLTLHHGGLTVELMHFGPAHTTNDTVVWLPAQRVLFAGDLLLPGCTPFVLMGSVAGSLEAIERMRALDPAVVVGGHGPVAGPEILDATESYLRRLQRLAADGVAAGLTPYETAQEAGPGEFAGLLDPERLVANLHRAFSEELGRPRLTEIRSAPVFAEMSKYLGGEPIVCRA